MSKVQIEGTKKKRSLSFMCPGCEREHTIKLSDSAYRFNGDVDRPTVSPAIKVSGTDKRSFMCHSRIEAGKIYFLEGCSHKLNGHMVALPEIKG